MALLLVSTWGGVPLRAQEGTAPPSSAEVGAAAPALGPGTPSAPEVQVTATPEKPAPAERKATVPPSPTPLLLNRALKLEDRPFRVFGWVQNSFTGNANGPPPSGTNFGVFPNHLANRWMGNQYYVALENPLNQVDTVNFGFRTDVLFGHDWQFTKAYGLFDRAWPPNHFAGIDLPQLYGEVHLPVLTPWGVDIRGGRFYSLTGYESPQAIARPLLSVPYSMNYTPFTFFGAVASLHLTPRLNLVNGTVNGFDRWIDRSYKWGYLGALTWSSRDQRTTLVVGGVRVPDQLPRFAPADSPFLPVGVPPAPLLAGRKNPFYGRSQRGYIVAVVTHKWSDKLTQALETDHVRDPLILGFAPNPHVAHGASYHGLVHWLLYQFTDEVTGVWRSEAFWDPCGLATGVADNFYEMTLGLNTRPRPWLWVRPEARYDWAQFGHPFNDGTRKGQLTLGIDVIVLF